MPTRRIAVIAMLLCAVGCVERLTYYCDGSGPDGVQDVAPSETSSDTSPDVGPGDAAPDLGLADAIPDASEELLPSDVLPETDPCLPDCAGKQCGEDGCGGSCGGCMRPWACQEGTCVCQPDCTDKDCGGDGCGGLCGECMGRNETCQGGVCACAADGCGEICCNPGEVCNGDGACCVPECAGKQCGSDGCGGVCGTCGDGESCFFVLCLPTQCEDGNGAAWDGCTAGQITEFQVNEVSTEGQQLPAVAALPEGGFTLAWESWNQDGLWNWGVIGHRFTSTGSSASGEFIVNSTTGGPQEACDVATLDGGGVAFVWESGNQDLDKDGVFAQVYSAEGVKLSVGDIPVNTWQTGDQRAPTVCGLAAGGFVVLWQSFGQEGATWGIYGQRFDGQGQAVGPELHVNQYEPANQHNPSLACLPGGGFVAVWESATQDGSFQGVYARLFDGAGQAASDELLVPAYTDWDQKEPAVAALSDDGFVVLWTTPYPGEDGQGIFGKRFTAAGNPLWGDFQVHTHTPGNQTAPGVAGFAAGGFVAVWESDGQDGSGKGIFGQRFDGAGDPAGQEFQVNVYNDSDQAAPVVAAFSDGSFIVAWQSLNQDGFSTGVFAQRFDPDGAKLEH
ncbi:MAG: hypothetical protein ABIK09_07585 [Pseudomonadota bacterium]